MTQDELLRLIDEAAADGRTALDLAGEGLSELPPEIGRLTQMKKLTLGRIDTKTFRWLGNDLRRLPDEISQLTSLKTLDLRRRAYSNSASFLC